MKETLRQRADALGMGDDFGEIRIPTETVVEFKGGKKRETQRKFFPGYILVEMEMSDAAWHVVQEHAEGDGLRGHRQEADAALRGRGRPASSSRW